MNKATAFLKKYIHERREYLERTMEQLKAHGSGPLVIREVAAGGVGYVELHNRGDVALDLGRYAVTNDLRSPLLHRLPAGWTLAPNQSLRFPTDGCPEPGHLPFTLSEQGGEVGVFDATRMSSSKAPKPLMYGPEDAVWFGPLPADTVYGRTSSDSEDFERRPYVP
jgi:spore coat protein H